MISPDAVCELYCETSPHGGAWNMAFDEALLERCLEQGVCHLRLYEWSQPTVSLGYFQDYHPPSFPEKLRSLEVVRRLSGGGAILHHHELTYSCCVPPEHPFAKTPSTIYQLVHEVFIDRLKTLGVECALRGSSLDFPQGEPFLCYSRGDANDVMCRQHKIIGSAQRRRRGAVLQHGSVLLKRSAYAAQFPGLEDLYPGVTIPESSEWKQDLCHRLAHILGRPRPIAEIDDRLLTQAKQFESEKYSFPSRQFARESDPDA